MIRSVIDHIGILFWFPVTNVSSINLCGKLLVPCFEPPINNNAACRVDKRTLFSKNYFLHDHFR